MEQEFLFSNSQTPNLLRYFRLGEEWHESFVIEFTLGTDHYEKLYWGDHIYVEESRCIISEMLTIAFLPDPHDKWKKENIDMILKGIDLTPILHHVENEIKLRTNKTT